MKAQHLEPRAELEDWIEVVRDVGGINAQLPSAMEMSLRARVNGLIYADLEAARIDQRSVVRTWCMRSTLHLLAADDLEWMLSTLDPTHLRSGWRWLDQRAGLDRERAGLMVETAVAILKAAGPLPRRALMQRVSDRLGFDALPAAAGAVMTGGLLGQIGFGPDRGTEPTYAALETWLGHPVTASFRPEHDRLARRYLHGYGPASPTDLAAWWGMGLSPARTAVEAVGSDLAEWRWEGQPVWSLREDVYQRELVTPAVPVVRLIPAFDTYLLGYRNREAAVAKADQGQVFHGGQVVPVVLVDGCAAGTWRYEQRGSQMRISTAPFREFSPPVREGIAGEAEDIGRFYGLRAVLSFA
jgi:hypothetical protein